jgi:hypothetical protein
MADRYAGIDWAADKHDVLVADDAGTEVLAATYAYEWLLLQRSLDVKVVRPCRLMTRMTRLTSHVVGGRTKHFGLTGRAGDA